MFLPCAVFKVRPSSQKAFGFEVSTYCRSFKTIQKSIILLSDSVDLLANFIDTLCRCCRCSFIGLPVFPASCSSFPNCRPRIWFLLQSPFLPRKEVIQPHLPIRLPCYDFTPVIGLTFGCCSLAVGSQTSGAPNSHGVTGGVYKARERIHRGMLIRDY